MEQITNNTIVKYCEKLGFAEARESDMTFKDALNKFINMHAWLSNHKGLAVNLSYISIMINNKVLFEYPN